MLSAMITWFSAVLAFFLLGVGVLSYTIVKRRTLSRFNTVMAEVRPGKRHYAVVTWTHRGITYSSSPLNVWAIHRKKMRILIDPERDTNYMMDIWTENYKWGYWLSALFLVTSVVLVTVLYMTH